MNLAVIQIFLTLALSVYASAVKVETPNDQISKLLLNGRHVGFTLQDYKTLIERGASMENYHLAFLKECTEPEAFVDFLCQSGLEIKADNLQDNFDDRHTFDLLFKYADDETKAKGLLQIFSTFCSMNGDFISFGIRAPSMASYAGAIGLLVPEYLDWFINLSFLCLISDLEGISVDFLKFFVNNGIDFNSVTFTQDHIFESFILLGRYDLTDYMADHGARLSKTKRMMHRGANFNAVQDFVVRRAWMKSVFPVFLAGMSDPESPISGMPKELPFNVVGGLLAELFEADIYDQDPTQ